MKVWRGIFVLCAGVGSCSMAAMEFKEAEITTIKNMVEHDPGSGAAPAKVNEKILEKSKVSTAAASMAELTFADTSITRMGANTQFSFRSKERLVKLDQGTILIHTPPGNGGATVEAGGVTAAVSGTTFMASRDGVGNVLFVLLEGQGGLKVTAGGSSTVIRPGQAASVGADSVKESPGVASSEKGPASPAAGPSASPGEEKGPGGSPAAGGGDSGGMPPPAAPKIQVFDIDVKRVVTTSPLVMDFQGELPSSAKIEKTIETQQQAVKEGKLEKLEVEAVAVKSTDGDLLVGAPKVEKEEFVVVNKKLDIVGKSTGGDGLDIDTAAGPGAGSGTGGGVAAAPAPRVETPTAPPAVTPPVNPGQTALQPPPAATTVAVIARVNDASRPFGQDNPSFGFNITTGSLLAGHSLVTDFLTSATRSSGVSASPFAVDFSNPKIVDSSGADVSSRYDLTTLPGVLNVVKAGQSVNFGSVGSLTFGQSVDLVASAFGGNVGFEVVSGPASVVNGKLVATSGTGEVVIRASTPGNENYLGAAAEQTITLAKAGQSVSFALPSSLTFDTTTGLGATVTGAGSVSYELVNAADASKVSISGGQLKALSGTGTVDIRAVTAGNDNYSGADAVQTITLAKAGQSVSFTLPSSLTFDTATSLGATVTGAGSVSYELVNAADASKVSISGGQLKALSGTGTVDIRAVTAGNDNYSGADAVQTITLAKAGQSVSFTLPSNLTFDQVTSLGAIPTGAGSVSYELVNAADASKVSISGGQLKALSGTGTVDIRAVTAGNDNYSGADAVQTITLAKAGQSVSFTLPSNLTFDQVTSLGAIPTGAGSVSYELVNAADASKVSISGGQLKALSGTGTVDIRAVTAGNDNYSGADAVQTITLAKAGQSVSFALPSSLTFDTTTGLGATVTGAGSVSYELVNAADASKVSISGGQLKALSGTGTVDIRAVTAGNDNYSGADAVQTITLAKAGQSVSFTLPSNLTFDQVTSLGAIPTGAGSVSYELVNAADASKVSISGGQLKALSGTGTVDIRAVTAGNDNYSGADAVQTITLAKAGQSVSFTLPSNLTFDQVTSLGAIPTGAGSVSYELVNAADASKVSISGGQLKALSGTGTVDIRAVTAGNDNYSGADAVQTITLAKAGQSVSFALPSSLTFDTTTGLGATVTGAGSVSYELVNAADASKVSISGGQLKALSGTGTVDIRAVTAGNDNYSGADAVQTITLAKAGQSVSFTLPSNLTFDQVTSLGAIPTGAGSVNYELVNAADASKVSISGGQLKALSGTGTVQVRAVTAGNDNYSGADAVQTITLQKADQNLGIDLVPYVLPGITPPSFVATATGAQTGSTSVSIQEVDGRASFDALTGQITVGKILGADSFTLLATATGNDNYNSARATRRVDINVDAAALDAANPARRLLTGPGSSAELEALDKFFYYTAKAADYAGDAPSGFFATDHQSKNLTFGQVESARLSQLYAGQTSDYFFMGNLNAGNVGVPEMNLQGRDRIIYADTVRIDPTVGAGRTLGETFSKGPAIPDGNPAGLARTLDLSSQGLTGSFSWFVDQVSLRIDGDPMAYGAFNGDFVSYFRHTKASGDSATVRLLDRMGSTVTEPEGSASNGLDVTFRDFASTAIHDADSAQAGGAIEGTYQPDRGVNPLTAGIGPVDPSGQFTLAVFDASSGAEGVLHSWSIDLVERFAISLENGAAKSFVLAAGDGGLFVKNTFWDLGGTRAEFTTTGNLSLQSDSFFFPGSSLKMEAAGSAELADVGVLGNPTAGSEVVIRARQDVTLTDTAIHEVGGQIEVASLNGAVELLASKTIGTQTVSGNVDLQAEGKIKITGATPVEIDTSAGVGSGGTSGPAAGNLAVVRSGDSLELRNVVIRGFSGARLENNAGRVLMSGSSVRDFKIKELTGMAVNADAKIQMAAYDSAGKLEGEMVVENHLPVAKASVAASTSLQAKLGSTELAEIMNDPQRRDVQLDAGQVDLAARKITFDNASVAALNSITARANTILIQNSFMTVVQNSGMINMYVSSGLVNQNYGTMVDGRVNFAGLNTFTIGNNSFAIGNQTQLNSAYGTNLIEIPNGGTPQAGKVNVLKL